MDTKDYPENYSEDARRILSAMSFGKGLMLLGSMSLRSMAFAGDYDGYEIVKMDTNPEKALHILAKRFQEMVRHLLQMKDVYIGDIKTGSVIDWRVLPADLTVMRNGTIHGYNAQVSREVVRRLHTLGIITADEEKKGVALLKPRLTPEEFFKAQEFFKFHVIRWTPKEVLANCVKLRDGSTRTLEEGFSSPGITKMDVIGLVQNSRYTDFSVIYEFRAKNKQLGGEPVNIEKSLKQDILANELSGNWFKALKRTFALAKYLNKTKTVDRLIPILNSDLGRLYHIVGDMKTLQDLLEYPNPPMEKIRLEIDQFIHRLSNIYVLKDVMKHEAHIIEAIHKAVKQPPGPLRATLGKLTDELSKYLQSNTKRIMGK